MDLQYLLTVPPVGAFYHHMPVKTAGTQQGRVEHIRPVGGGHDNDLLVGIEAVHLGQELVEGLLTLVVTAAETRAAAPAHRIDFIDENDAGSRLLCIGKEITHPPRPDTDKHLDELGCRNAEKRNTRLSCHGPCQQGLAGARRPHQEYTFGDFSANPLKFLRVFQEFDDLFQFPFLILHAGHIVRRSR